MLFTVQQQLIDPTDLSNPCMPYLLDYTIYPLVLNLWTTHYNYIWMRRIEYLHVAWCCYVGLAVIMHHCSFCLQMSAVKLGVTSMLCF